MKLLSYLKYLSPILISKHSYYFDYKLFIKALRLKTQSQFSDKKQKIIDEKIGRRNLNNNDILTLYEYDLMFLIRFNPFKNKSALNNMFPTTLLIFSPEKQSFKIVNYPGFTGSVYTLAMLLCFLGSMLFFTDEIKLILGSFIVYIFFNTMTHSECKVQNKLIEETINELEKQKENILPLNPPPKGEV